MSEKFFDPKKSRTKKFSTFLVDKIFFIFRFFPMIWKFQSVAKTLVWPAQKVDWPAQSRGGPHALHPLGYPSLRDSILATGPYYTRLDPRGSSPPKGAS